MNRRGFITQAACVAGAAVKRHVFGRVYYAVAPTSAARLTLHPGQVVAAIPADFIGLGYEISSVARPGLLNRKNAVYVQLVRTLGSKGVVRIGGNTADDSSYEANGEPQSVPEDKGGSVVNDAVLRDLGGFLDATGWQLIWGLNLGRDDEQQAIAEAKAVTAAAGSHLLAFEIGNEPDLFRGRHRKSVYSYDDYLSEYRKYRDTLRKELPQMPLAGPDVAGATSWVTRFAGDEGKDVKLLTHHYYRENQNPASSIDKLLQTDPKLGPLLTQLQAASRSSRVPYRICEVNSFSGGGKPGVSDTLASALWVLDFMYTLASAGCAGVNMETGVNQRGFISSYSPIGDDEQGRYSATPEYYGMLAFAQSAGTRIIATDLEAGAKNLQAYATQQDDGQLIVTLINKESGSDAEVTIAGAGRAATASVMRLTGPSLASRTGVTLAGAAVSATGTWKAAHHETMNISRGTLKVHVPAASAALVTLKV